MRRSWAALSLIFLLPDPPPGADARPAAAAPGSCWRLSVENGKWAPGACPGSRLRLRGGGPGLDARDPGEGGEDMGAPPRANVVWKAKGQRVKAWEKEPGGMHIADMMEHLRLRAGDSFSANLAGEKQDGAPPGVGSHPAAAACAAALGAGNALAARGDSRVEITRGGSMGMGEGKNASGGVRLE
ncbi:hypothetical protein T484DRAFT_1878368, partial [Baffinella frigidus]